MFYICNEALSLLENAAMFIPIPDKLKDCLLYTSLPSMKIPITGSNWFMTMRTPGSGRFISHRICLLYTSRCV